MRVRLFVALLAVASLTGFAPVPKPRPAKGPDPKEIAKSMQGTWQVVGTERAGIKARLTSSPTRHIQITDNKWQNVYPNDAGGPGGLRVTSLSYNIILDTSKSPVTIDLQRPANNTVYMSGVVTVEGDTMKFCYILGSRLASGEGASRPMSFDPIPPGATLMTLKRVKP